jgi:hypothetical protein
VARAVAPLARAGPRPCTRPGDTPGTPVFYDRVFLAIVAPEGRGGAVGDCDNKGKHMDTLIPRAAEIGEMLKARKETIGIAESSTGGLISAALLAQPGASA